MAKICALVLMTLVSLVFAEEQNLEDDPFTFDYHRLRVGGLILAAVLCLIGITILLKGGQQAMLSRCSLSKVVPATARCGSAHTGFPNLQPTENTEQRQQRQAENIQPEALVYS
ncbi:phospholemman [Xyrichtys novacula]|uniref:FXYD domain-containing ion transport regulator n=1 Tax=Xyrichtys novacula TaxID=13765 RepID=A0AAV1FM85_XYRNO|nr:phospholemman [Xyrichtys novacula]